MARLRDLNQLDLELWSFAEQLVARRMQIAARYFAALGGSHGTEQQRGKGRCNGNGRPLPASLEKHVGIFRPPGHKGPL